MKSLDTFLHVKLPLLAPLKYSCIVAVKTNGFCKVCCWFGPQTDMFADLPTDSQNEVTHNGNSCKQ